MLFEQLYAYYRTLGPRGRAVLFQLPLSTTMLLVTVLTMILHPQLDVSGPFLFSLGAHVLLLGACAVVPWARLTERAVLIIPVLGCIVVGLSREAADQYLAVLGFLLVFPVVWLAADRRRSGVLFAVVATILSAVLPPAILGTGFDGPDFIRIVLLPVILGAIALTAHGIVNALSLQRQQLKAQSCEVRDLLVASEDRERLLSSVMDTVSVGVCAVDATVRRCLPITNSAAISAAPSPGGSCPMNHRASSSMVLTGSMPCLRSSAPGFGRHEESPSPTN